MLQIFRHVQSPVRTQCIKYRRAQGTGSTKGFIPQLERDGERILRVVRNRLEERAKLISQIPDGMVSSEDISRAKQVKETEPLQAAWKEWINAQKLLRETMPLLTDPDPTMRSLASEEFRALTAMLSQQISTVFPRLLVPPSATANLSALVELKSGVGGAESSLFLAELLRMYSRLANAMNWKTQLVASNELDGRGMKDAILEIKGPSSYDALRWESGVHRVQRVPATEASGRVHTSTVTVLVLPLSEQGESDGNSELFSMEDVKVEVMRARGAGGQHVNTTESAVRLTHLPSGITVSMQDERSQHQNRRRAFQVLSARLMDLKLIKEMEERRTTRRNLVKTADRSEKIRTYNVAQDRVTDHRIGLTLKNMRSVMEGYGLRYFIDALKTDHEKVVMEDVLKEA